MQFKFFATYPDKIQILDHIFKSTGFKIVDHYSAPGQDLREYISVSEIADIYDLENGNEKAAHLALWKSTFGEKNIARRIELNPKYCNGNTFRYAATGWSLQQLYFGNVANETLNYSTLQGFNKQGALLKDSIYPIAQRTAHLLDWARIQTDQRKLKYFIETRLTSRKINSYLILKNADKELQTGHLKI